MPLTAEFLAELSQVSQAGWTLGPSPCRPCQHPPAYGAPGPSLLPGSPSNMAHTLPTPNSSLSGRTDLCWINTFWLLGSRSVFHNVCPDGTYLGP